MRGLGFFSRVEEVKYFWSSPNIIEVNEVKKAVSLGRDARLGRSRLS